MECKNCTSELSTASRYCSFCGAKVIKNRLTFKNLFQHFSEQFFNYDNALFITIRHLIVQPELVINGFIGGLRKKYVNPVSFYAISISFAGLLIFFVRRFFADQFTMDFMGEEVGNNMPFEPQKVFEFQTLLSILNIPILAILSKIVFFNIKKYNYTEHLVIYMYTGALLTIFNFFIALVVLSLGANFFLYTYAFMVVMILYTAYCLKRTFGLSLKGIVLRTIGFFFLSLLALLTMSIVFAVIMKATNMLPNSP